MSAILLTGASGYVGGRLLRHLLGTTDSELRVLTRNPMAFLEAGRSDPVIGGRFAERVFAALYDPTDAAALRCALEGTDVVIHLASLNEVKCGESAVDALEVNTMHSVRLLEACLVARTRRFVFLSTAHVYGTNLAGRVDERTLPRPTHAYAITHRAVEDFLYGAHAQGRIEGVSLRLSNSVGAPASARVDRWTLLVNDLCRSAVETGTLRLRSDGLQWRDFVPLSDVCRAITHAIDLPLAKSDAGVFNLGFGQSLTVIEMAEIIAARAEALFGTRPKLERPEPAPGASPPAHLEYVVSKLAATGFESRSGLVDAVDETLLFCRNSFSSAK